MNGQMVDLAGRSLGRARPQPANDAKMRLRL